MTIVTITLLKRHADLTREAFVEHYETVHRAIGERHLARFASGYRRRYLRPRIDPVTGRELPSDFDVLMEIEYPDAEAQAAAMRALADPAARAEIAADEDKLFDRASTRHFQIEDERVSILPSADGGASADSNDTNGDH